jgi:Spy/CpxP family protein refolding chaperone
MAETDSPASPPASTRRWGKTVLVLSLALNLMFLGLLGGAILRGGPQGRDMMVRDVNFGPLSEAFSKADRAALRRDFLKAAPDVKGQRQAMQDDMAAMLDVLRAPVFERAKVEAIFARQADRTADRQRLGQDLVLDLVADMTPETRKDFAARLEEALKKRKKPQAP